MPSEDVVKDAAEGAAKGAVKAVFEFSESKIRQLAGKILQGELGFIGDPKTIEIVKSQRKKPEWALYRQYVKSQDLRLQIEMGFSLKQLESEKARLLDLRDKIHRRYGAEGLHIAELTQNGVLVRYIGLLLKNAEDEKELEEKMESILHEIEKYVKFIKSEDDVGKISRELIIRIQANLPRAMIVFSRGEFANKKANEILENVMTEISGYHRESQFDYDSAQQFDFIVRSP